MNVGVEVGAVTLLVSTHANQVDVSVLSVIPKRLRADMLGILCPPFILSLTAPLLVGVIIRPGLRI